VAIKHGTRLFPTLFISDVHLGARGCWAERLLDFQRYHWSAISSAATIALRLVLAAAVQ
jgi:hypothetical protein